MRNDGTRCTRFDMIANQMMKGCNGNCRQGNIAGTDEQMNDFKRVYVDTISYLEALFPKASTVSVGVLGALGKAILWHGKEKMRPFIEGVAYREFKGRADPCHVLWEWLIRYNKRNPNETYRKTVTAIRMFLRGVQCKSHMKPALDDIFEWDSNYRRMYQTKKNQHGTTTKAYKQTDEAIFADVEDVLSGCPT